MFFNCRHLFPLTVYVSILLLLGGFVLGVISMPKSVYATKSDGFFDGKWTSSFERHFDEYLVHHPLSVSFWNGAYYAFFKEGKDGVLIGDEGWLFTTEEFEQPNKFEQNISDNLSYIKTINDFFDRFNIELIVVPIPAKARVLSHRLGRYEYPDYWQNIYPQFISFLSNNKIKSFDLLSEIKEPESFFLKTDTHWSLAGAAFTAKKISADINRRNLSPYEKSYHLNRDETQNIKGDLTRYTMNMPETISTISLTDNTSDDLFGDPYIPITLVGTSYSANKKWGFESWLKYYLQVDVLNMADEGLGPFEVMDSYINSSEYENIKPKLIIWEIPERYLSVQYEKTLK